MGIALSYLSKFRKKESTKEILQRIEEDIKERQSTLEQISLFKSTASSFMLTNSFLICFVAALAFYSCFLPQKWSDRFLFFLPFLVVPILVFVLWKLSDVYSVTVSNEIKELKNKKKKLVDGQEKPLVTQGQDMKDYRIEPEEFKFCIISPERKREINKMLLSNSDNFNHWKEEAICCKYLAANCENSSLCHLIHSPRKLPYVWQSKMANEDRWDNFPFELNVKMEEEFCDPSKDSWSSGLPVTCESFLTLSDINCNKYNDKRVEIRRLSTKSSVKGKEDDYYLTEWQWYWKGSTKWHKYDNLTDKIELAFLNDESSFKFKTIELVHVLSFDTMEERNQNIKTAVCRRPIFKGKEDILRPISVFQTPPHWPPKHGRGERISLESHKYQELKNAFEKSIGMGIIVSDIQEICNKEHYDSYERHEGLPY